MKKKYIFYLLFIACGITASIIFKTTEKGAIKTGLICGSLFIVTAFICSFFVTKIKPVNAALFLVLSFITYTALYIGTLFSYALAYFVGIITGGIGSLLFFILFSAFIKKIKYNKLAVFGLGTLAFAINDLFLFTPLSNYADSLFKQDIEGNFCSIFFLWQTIIGIKLTNHITKSDVLSRESNRAEPRA